VTTDPNFALSKKKKREYCSEEARQKQARRKSKQGIVAKAKASVGRGHQRAGVWGSSRRQICAALSHRFGLGVLTSRSPPARPVSFLSHLCKQKGRVASVVERRAEEGRGESIRQSKAGQSTRQVVVEGSCVVGAGRPVWLVPTTARMCRKIQ
jgi:hypothetical protein